MELKTDGNLPSRLMAGHPVGLKEPENLKWVWEPAWRTFARAGYYAVIVFFNLLVSSVLIILLAFLFYPDQFRGFISWVLNYFSGAPPIK
jgi:hypothetical protein